jgi:hypothetical protein
MSSTAPPITGQTTRLDTTQDRTRGDMWRPVIFLWKYFLGALFCTNVVFSVLVVGWAQRTMARGVLASLVGTKPSAQEGTFVRGVSQRRRRTGAVPSLAPTGFSSKASPVAGSQV